MRRFVTLAMAIAALVPAIPAGAAGECATATIGPDYSVVTVDWGSVPDGEIRMSPVGRFLWIQFGHPDDPDDGYTDTISIDITAVASVEACVDGAVTVASIPGPTLDPLVGDSNTPPLSPPAEGPEPLPDLGDLCETFGSSILSRLCALDPTLAVRALFG